MRIEFKMNPKNSKICVGIITDFSGWILKPRLTKSCIACNVASSHSV